jgi:hypothetical protein
MTTEAHSIAGETPAAAPRRPGRRRVGADPRTDRLTVVLFSLACFLALLALLSSQLRAGSTSPRPVVVLRKIYRTTVITTIAGGTGPNGTSVSQSVSGSGALPVAAPTTRTS